MKKNFIHIIIVTYNATKWIDKCLGSLSIGDPSTKIIIIDNGSIDNTVKIIEENYPLVVLIKSKINLGFGKANNIGLKKALDEGADYVLLLNQDAWVYKDTIKGLIEISKKYPEYGVISPVHLANNGQSLDNNFTNYINGHSCPNFLNDLIFKKKIKDIYETDFVNAACWLITKNCLETIGGFDPLFMHYGEDDDYINRVKYHGLKVGICPNYFAVHERPQIISNKISYERKYGNQLHELKKLGKAFPKKYYFILKCIEAAIKKLLFRRDSDEYKIWCKFFKDYALINSHIKLSKIKSPTFLSNE